MSTFFLLSLLLIITIITVRKFTRTDRNGPNYRIGPERTHFFPYFISFFIIIIFNFPFLLSLPLINCNAESSLIFFCNIKKIIHVTLDYDHGDTELISIALYYFE